MVKGFTRRTCTRVLGSGAHTVVLRYARAR